MAAHTFEQDATWTFSSCYYQADNTNTASTSCAPILQPRPVRAVPGVPAWGADWFPGENSLGLTSSDAKYADAGLPKEPAAIRDQSARSSSANSRLRRGGRLDGRRVGQDLPADATPPPRPVPRSIDLLPPSILERLPLGDGSNVRLPLGDHLVAAPAFWSRDSTPLPSPPPYRSRKSSASSQKSFAALPFAVDAHLTLCDRIGEALHAVQLWHLRSESCQRKYDHRLMSLRKTLQRLHRLANAFPLRHHTKLADLADKFNATFDRLKVRHLHRILSDAYADAVKRIPFPHTTTDLFDCSGRRRGRPRAPPARLGRYDYALHREGRRPSLVVAQ
ncbi:hypothetical protein C8J57DRAFT_1282270 [Mycena rebaudengoi]|nr:hypothetical protein C8J57DRAFT_1282270 [Mycena rebaudengoi]